MEGNKFIIKLAIKTLNPSSDHQQWLERVIFEPLFGFCVSISKLSIFNRK